MKSSRFFVGSALSIIVLGALTLLPLRVESRGLGSSALAEGLRLLIDLQETQATVTARWFYEPPPDYTTFYEYTIVSEATQDTVVRDSTELMEATAVISRVATDIVYSFEVRVWLTDPVGGGRNHSAWLTERFLVPARPDAILLAKRDMVTEPTIIPNDPAFEQPEGTLWLDFETTPDIQTYQGLWSRDATGFEGGGHLTVTIVDGSVVTRIQSDTNSVQLQWPIVANATNQLGLEFGPAGLRLHVNGTFVMQDSFPGGTVGNSNDIVVGASKQSYNPDGSTPEYTAPFLGQVSESEFYLGRYDFSGRWGAAPVPVPPPVDSMVIEVAGIDHGQVVPEMDWGGQAVQADYFTVRFTPIPEAAYIVRMVNGDTLDHRGVWQEAKLPVAGGDWRVSCSGACQSDPSWTGWEMFNERTGAHCAAPSSGWSSEGTLPCVTKQHILANNERNNDCVGGRYWAKHDSEIECNFNIKSSLRAGFIFPRGTNPVLRFEVFDAQRQRIGYWERRVA